MIVPIFSDDYRTSLAIGEFIIEKNCKAMPISYQEVAEAFCYQEVAEAFCLMQAALFHGSKKISGKILGRNAFEVRILK